MYPIYGCMDSYPQQRPYAPYNPNLKSVPYQMKPDFAKSPPPYEYGPYGINNYYHPHPMEFHSCCNHNYFPSCYTFRPPYPHLPPPQPFHCHGGYAPHPRYPMELPPRYEYDKNTPRDHHCCGCPNHSCTRKDDQIVKIEEPDPDGEKKTGDSLVSHQLKNYPYPVVWIPPGYLKNKEEGKGIPVEVESKDKERNENSKSFEEEPRFLNGWLPLDMNKLGSLMQGGDGRKVQNQINDEEGRFPFSIFRVPYKPEELERNGSKENKLPLHFSITPVDASDTEDSKSKSLVRGTGEDSDCVRKIPEKVEKKTEKEPEGKAKSIPVEFRTENGERKIVKNSEKRRSSSSSPPKSSKLPPVCLRVDPLPGKKSSSRSPSPPASKGKSEKSTSENSKISVLPNVKENCQENMQPSKPVEESKATEVFEVVGNDSKNEKCGSEEVAGAKNVILGQSGDGKCEVGEGKVERETIKEKADKEVNKAGRKNFSDGEAAVIIQSAYRGYEVRKWEPLIKLKQIAKVKEQAAEVKRSIEALESLVDVRSDDKQRLVIGETIMSLLLKLDTIQGLHPSIRDIRKSAARELVSLQEKLDALITKNPIEHLSTTATTSATSEAVENVEPVLVDKKECGYLENKSTESSAANEKANVEERKDKVLSIENSEDLELKPSNEVLSVTANHIGEFGREAEEENDEKVLEKAQGEGLNHADEPGVVEDINGKAEESLLQPLEDEARKADDVVLSFEAEEPKPDIPIIEEENDEKVLEETKVEAEAQPEEAQREAFDHTVEEITGKTEEFVVQPLEYEVPHDEVQPVQTEEVFNHMEEPVVVVDEITGKTDEAEEPVVVVVNEITRKTDEVQAVEAEEPVVDEITGKTDEVQEVEAEEPVVVVDEITGKAGEAQVVEAEEPQPKLPFVEGEPLTGELTETNDEFSGPKDVILVKEEKEAVNGDKELVADNIIEQRSKDTEEFVSQRSEEKLREENEKLKEMVEKLVEAGKEQLSAISNLSSKVKDLERILSKKKKLRMRKCAKKSRTFDDQIQMVC